MATNDFNSDFRSQLNHNHPANHRGDSYSHSQDTMGTLHQPPSFPPSTSRPVYDTQYDAYTHRPQYSQNSFHDETSFMGGSIPGADNDREDIPLKAHAQSQTQGPEEPRWMNEDVNYGAGAPMDPDLSTRRKRRRTKKNRFFDRRTPWVTWFLTAVDIGVFIGELIYSTQLTGSPIEIHPTFNPMIGPSPYVQINMGSRFVACMKNIPGIQDANATISWPCPNTTTTDVNATTNHCTLSELCGFSGVPNPKPNGSLNDQPEPNQWFRFIVPMFLHAGFVHIGFNMLMQLTIGADVEKKIGWWRYSLVYFSSGIFGFVMGGNYAAQGISSTGASGSLFGLVALTLLDLLYTWNEKIKPWVELIFLVVEIAVSFVLGLLPGLDNFSHIGGFIMGLAMGLCMMRSPNYIRERIGLQRRPYVVMSGGGGPPAADDSSNINPIAGNYADTDTRKGTAVAGRAMKTFQGRKPLWWAWWLVRAGALVAVVIGFILLVTDFYKYPKSTCSWCYRLSCLPVNNWCSIGNLDLTSTSSS